MMKKIIALSLAATLATASVAATTAGSALAAPKSGWNDNWKKNNWKGGKWKGGNWDHNWRRSHRGYDGGFLLPFVLGGALGYGLGHSYSAPYYDYGPSYAYSGDFGSAHAQWCASRYRTYNPVTNLYFARPGVPKVCYSPYGG
jgi:hypothetical protein